MGTKFRFIGITDETVECQHCGKADLKSTVVLAVLDADGNTETITYYGSSCAARALSVEGGSRAVLRSAQGAQQRLADAARDARERLTAYGLPLIGHADAATFDAAVAKYMTVNNNAMWASDKTLGQWRAMVLDMIARSQSVLADAALVSV